MHSTISDASVVNIVGSSYLTSLPHILKVKKSANFWFSKRIQNSWNLDIITKSYERIF